MMMISVSRVAKCHGYSNYIHVGYDDEVDDDDINDVDHSIGTDNEVDDDDQFRNVVLAILVDFCLVTC